MAFHLLDRAPPVHLGPHPVRTVQFLLEVRHLPTVVSAAWKLPATSAPAVARLDLFLASDMGLLDDDCVMHAPEGVGSVGICWDGSDAAAVVEHVEHVALDDSMLREAWGRRSSH